jgi:hypothetical protein
MSYDSAPARPIVLAGISLVCDHAHIGGRESFFRFDGRELDQNVVIQRLIIVRVRHHNFAEMDEGVALIAGPYHKAKTSRCIEKFHSASLARHFFACHFRNPSF